MIFKAEKDFHDSKRKRKTKHYVPNTNDSNDMML